MFKESQGSKFKINYLNGRWCVAAERSLGPGRDEDPARHAPEPGPGQPPPPSAAGAAQGQASGPVRAGDAPLPAAPALAEEADLPAAGPDWLDDAGWAAIVAASEDEEEPVDPDLEDDPADWEDLDAVIAAAREHASPPAGFESGGALDSTPGCVQLAMFADGVAGPDDRYQGVSDDEVMGVIRAWNRAEAHAAARKLAAIAELIRRRPAEDSAPPSSGQGPGTDAKSQDRAPEGSADGSPASCGAAEKTSAQMPARWDEFAVEELSCALAESRAAAEGLLDLARDLAVRLPGTMAALRNGVISQAKADIIYRATKALNTKETAAAEELVLGRAGRLTRPGLRAAIARAVMEVAPKKARKRREEWARQRRVERWMEDSGNASLAGRELPPAQVLAADQRITAWAKELRAAGLDGDMDVLRATAYLDILLGMDSRPAPSVSESPATESPATESPATESPGGPPATNAWDYRPQADPFPAGPFPAGFAARLNLTVPLATVLGLADRPGEAGALGPIDPWLARDLARAAAHNPQTTWCVTVTDEHGHAIGHGCARPASKAPRTSQPKQRKPGPPGSPAPPGSHDPPGDHDPPGAGGPGGQRFSFTATATDDRGPPGGYGTWRLSTGVPGQRDLVVAIGPVATDECDHRHEARGHDPGVLLRHLTEVRHATCTAPTCRRPASHCDFEHNIPYEAGGRTCMCNGGPKCRYHHRLKQDPTWQVEQPTPAVIRWKTPAGRLYTTEPTRYPI